VELVGEDGERVQIPTVQGSGEPFGLDMAFNVGRPAGLHPGDDQVVALAANLVGLPFPASGKYEFLISIDGDPAPRRLPIRLEPAPGGQLSFG
jgi:hypothetical protein